MHATATSPAISSATAPADAPAALSRRGFLGTGLVLAIAGPLGGAPEGAGATGADQRVTSWLTVGTDNSVTLTIGSSDMGQGSFQGLAQILAEDLVVDPRRVRLVQGGPTMASPAPIGTAINTVGSSVTRANYWRLRDSGAAAREMLLAAAMARVGDGNRANYAITDGVIAHAPSGQRIAYGDVAAAAALLPVPTGAPLVPDSQFRSIGQPLPRQDIPGKVDGSAVYGIDVRVPGLVYAVIRHCPAVGGTLAALPPTPAGAIAVVPVAVAPGTGRGGNVAGNVNAVAVVAGTTWDAMRLARGLSIKWNVPASASTLDDARMLADAQALASSATPYAAGAVNGPGTLYTVEASTGRPEDALSQPGTTVLQADYVLPYLSHACMEVLNCTVDFVPGVRCAVHAPTQSARGALALVMQLTGLPESQVTLRTTMLGGGLGRKAEQDFIGQAVQVGMAVKRPVMLVWPREEDFTHDQYRPMALVRVKAGLANGAIAGWVYRNVSPSILAQRGAVLGARGDSQGYEASNALPYAMTTRRVEWVSHPSPVPVGFWRSVGASINTFAVESMIDELAAAGRQDPWQFRRTRMTDPRWLAVLDAAASASGWTTPPGAGRARGIAIGAAFNTVVAMVVEVSGTSVTSFKVTRVWVAVDPYLVVNPLNVEAQIVGGVVHGLNAALYGQQNFVGGVAQRRNFNSNRMIRLQEMPQVQVVLMPRPAQADRTQPIGGIGELGVPTLAPALANALFRLTGQRVRKLPFFASATMGG